MNDLMDSLGFEGETDTISSLPEIKPTTEEISANAADIHTRAKADLDFLAALAIPEIFQFAFPFTLKAAWDWLLSYTNKVREFPQLALGLPRGFAKTTVIKLYVLYCILFTNKKFILIISSSASLAENIISDIADMLNEGNIKTVFGDWKIGIEIDRQNLKKFGFRGRNIILAGIGAGTSLRGLNIKNVRPDVMIFEDIQTKEDAESKPISTALETWMLSTAMKAKSPFGCMFIFVANMYPTEFSILKRLKKNPNWTKFIVGGILSDGSSLWEDLHPITQLLKEYENDLTAGRPEIFYSEVLNDENVSVNNLVDISTLPQYPYEDDEISAGSFIIIDPAGNKSNSDATSIGLFEIYNALPAMTRVIEDNLSPGDTIRKALTMALENRVSVIAIESNAYQASLCYWFNVICQQLQIEGIQAVEVYSGPRSKNSRILDMFKSLKAGELFYHSRTTANVNAQIRSFNPLKTNNTDGVLDLLTYAPRVMEQYGHEICANSIIDGQEFDSAKVLEFNSAF